MTLELPCRKPPREYVGGTGTISVGSRYQLLNDIYSISSIISFGSIWITIALIVKYYREKSINPVVYWTTLSIPLIYFLVNYTSKFVFANILGSYLTDDPISASIVLTRFCL
jgi:hypothetical protein